MTKIRWNLVDPRAPRSSETSTIVVGERHPGGRLGVLSNRKPNATVVGQEWQRLAIEHGLASELHVYEKQEGPGMPASSELLDRIAAECDAVIVGSAD